MRYHISVSPLVAQGLLVLGLVFLIGLWSVGSSRTEETFTDDIGLRLIAASNVIATRIADWDDTNIRVLNQVVRLPDMVSMEGPRQVPLLKSISDSYDWIFLSLTTTPTGENVARNDGQPLRPYDDRAWFQSVIGGAPFARQLLISKTTGKPALVLARPIRDGAGRLIGVVCISMFLTEISKAISTAKIGETGYAVLLDEKNMVIAHGNPANVRAALEDFGDHPALAAVGADARPAVYSLADKKVVAFARKRPQGWSLLVEQDYQEAFSPARGG
ncbi:cache domain-containing protein [Roseateles oligotrophus]|uniref:Cache domain-containing protein n=1 Tax=Roseateles oligotrophus TaxID=1769250 RepID=A0ABT2YKY5_9BURK|nr:cache domain-containing protein [Roseateles oligotrophus]MCV2370728.1 cache domain-containing protein [Roseateles oligotrophus]